MQSVQDAAVALVGAGMLALVGSLLRYREWTAPVAAFVSGADPRADAVATARAAGRGLLLMALPLGLYGVALLVAPSGWNLAPVAYLLVAFVLYRALHWIVRADSGPRTPRNRR